VENQNFNSTVARYVKYSGYLLLIVNIFVKYWQFQWVLPFILYSLSYIILNKWKNFIIMWVLIGSLYALSLIIPIYMFPIVVLIILIWRVFFWKQQIDSGNMDDSYTEAQIMTAKIQLKMCNAVKKAGQTVDPELERKLKRVIYGEIEQENINR